jgi:hypothetical protein
MALCEPSNTFSGDYYSQFGKHSVNGCLILQPFPSNVRVQLKENGHFDANMKINTGKTFSPYVSIKPGLRE